jgi:hypothetical protein
MRNFASYMEENKRGQKLTINIINGLDQIPGAKLAEKVTSENTLWFKEGVLISDDEHTWGVFYPWHNISSIKTERDAP